MRRLTAVLLILGAFAPTALAQYAEQVTKGRHKVLASWLRIVRAAETEYKSKHGRYGGLTALRDAHMLDTLNFESEKLTATEPVTSLVPQSTRFEVTAPGEGRPYKVSICEVLEESSICVFGDEMGAGYSRGRQPLPPPEDGPEGPLLSLPG